MIYLIYLAAGSARRFGQNKLLAPLHGRPVYRYGLESLQTAAAGRADCRILVVSRTDEILQAAKAMGFTPVESPDSGKGMSCTIRAGICAAGKLQAGDYLLFAVADQPWLTAASVEKLLDTARAGCFAATAMYNGQAGSPTVFSAALAPELCALQGDSGGRRVLNRYPGRVIPVPLASPRELADIDTPADLARAQQE